jgi:hypothetical protein
MFEYDEFAPVAKALCEEYISGNLMWELPEIHYATRLKRTSMFKGADTVCVRL